VVELSKVEAQEVLGLDLGDRSSQICRMDRKTGAVLEERRLSTTTASVQRYFSALPPQLVALESGTHSLWMTRLVKSLATRSSWPIPVRYGPSRRCLNPRTRTETLIARTKCALGTARVAGSSASFSGID